jgi:hypothetical protein
VRGKNNDNLKKIILWEVQIVTLGSIKGFSSKVHIFHDAWAKKIPEIKVHTVKAAILEKQTNHRKIHVV